MNALDLFSGTGAFALGFEAAGITTSAFCECDEHCATVLRHHFPGVPVFRDVRELSVSAGYADVVTGGFPCQPFSSAARGRHTAADLWPEFLRIVHECRPTWVVAENVPGIGDDGTERVSRGLEAEGFEVWPFDVDTALPQRQRGRHRRIWLAHSDRNRQSRRAEHAQVACVPSIPGRYWQDDPPPVGVDDGLAGRMDRRRLSMLGNAATLNIAEAIGRTIMRAGYV